MTADEMILICYDGSDDAERAIETAAELFGPRRAVVVDVAPTMTFAEGVAATSSLVGGGAFDELNTAEALRCAKAGAAHARRVGLDAEPRATIAPATWQGIVDVAAEVDAAAIVVGRAASAAFTSSPAAASRMTSRRTRGGRY